MANEQQALNDMLAEYESVTPQDRDAARKERKLSSSDSTAPRPAAAFTSAIVPQIQRDDDDEPTFAAARAQAPTAAHTPPPSPADGATPALTTAAAASSSSFALPSPPSPRPQSASPQLSPLGARLENFLQQYQRDPADGRLYALGADGLFYDRNAKGQFVRITPELQAQLQHQQATNSPPPLCQTQAGNIYQEGAQTSRRRSSCQSRDYFSAPNGHFYEMATVSANAQKRLKSA